MQVRSTFNFRVEPQGAGVVSVPEFVVKTGSRTVKVPATQLQVRPPGLPGPAPVRMTLETRTNVVYVGQTVTARLTLMDSGDGTVAALSQPQVIGESLLVEPSFGRMMRQIVNQQGRMQTAFVTDLLFTPMREGPLQVFGQAQVILGMVDPNRFKGLQNYYPLYDTEPVELTVQRVPDAGKLPGYTGAIGQFIVDPPELSAPEVRVGEPLLMRVIVRGDGNFKRFTPPLPAADGQWQVFPAGSESGSGNSMMQQGYAVFGYTLVPLDAQAKATPAIPFSAFDPETRSYVSHTIPAVPVKVIEAGKPTAKAADMLAPSAANEDDTDATPTLGGLMETAAGTNRALDPVQTHGWFLALQLVPAVALAALWAWDRRRRFLEDHPELVRRRRARRAMQRELKLARQAAHAGDAAGYLRAAANALREGSAPHTEANPAAFVARDVVHELPHTVAVGEDGALVQKLFAELDAARITGRFPGREELLRHHAGVERLAQRLEERLKG
jgi:hypothetical protein